MDDSSFDARPDPRRPAQRGIRLRNCPFHGLAGEFPPLACWLNLELLRQRRSWFEPFSAAHLALWWVPAGTVPTLEEGGERLETLREKGPTPAAFTLRSAFDPPATPQQPHL